VPVAHNLAFDRRFITAEFERAAISPATAVPGYCTMQEWRRRQSTGGSAKLDVVLASLGLSRADRSHGALEDALLAAQVLRWLHHLPPKLNIPLGKPTNER
jgi:DNA polymerase-3 subunit epsilon